MNTYYCKCRMQVQSGANGATTALKNPERYYPNRLHEYGETSDLSCKGCPYICIRKQYAQKAGDPSVTETHEARMSKDPPVYVTRAVKWNPSDVTVCKVHTLDFDFAKRFTDAEKTIDGIMEDRYWDHPDYQISQYNADGMFTLTVNPEPGKRGIAAKQQLWDMFFLPGGYRKDLSPDEEKEKILRGIVAARQAAQGKGEQQMSYKSEDVYVSPEGVRYRIHYDQNVKAYHTEVKADGEWKPHNSSWYPHFPHACGEFAAVVKIHNLVKQEDKACNTDQPEHAGSESIAAAEALGVSPADVESAMSTLPDAEPASLAPAFDFDADEATNVQLMQCAQVFLVGRVQQCLAAKQAHDITAKCRVGSWGKWCSAVGISRDTGESLVRIAELFGNYKLDGKPLIEALPPTLLYAAAKPSAPPELVQQVKSGDITTNKQFQEAIAARKAAEEAQRAAEVERDKAEKALARAESEAELDRKEQEDANAAAQRFKAEAERRAQDQIRLEGLLHTREDEIARLTSENRELQKRPVTEVLPPDPEEVARRVKEQVGLVWEQNKALKEIIEDREPSPDEKAAMFGQLQRFCHSIIDQWDLIKAKLAVLPKELRNQFREGFIKNLRIIEKEVDEY